MKNILCLFLMCFIVSVSAYAKIKTAVSILPQKYFVERIGGKYVDAVEMIPAGSTPHTFEFSIHVMKQLSQCQLYIYLGHKKLVFEKQIIQKVRSQNKNIEFINASEGMEYIENDGHVWTAPSSAIIMSKNIARAFINIDPQHREYYERNLHNFIAEINDLDSFIRNSLTSYNDRYFMVYHPAWGYFARDYDLTQIAIEHHGKEPTTYQLMKTIKKAQLLNVKAIFVQPHFSAATAQQMAQQIGAQIIRIDPLAYNWLENMKTIALNFKKAFEK